MSVNLRPSYVVPLAIAVAILLITNPRRIAVTIPGIVVAYVPQFVFNIIVYRSVGAFPCATGSLAAVQASQATYAVRHDTLLTRGRNPQQWYCDPHYAAQVVGDAVAHNQVGVVGSVFNHLPDSLWFLTEKTAASLQWSFVTPYEHDPGPGTSLTSLLAVGVAAAGIVALVIRAFLARHDRPRFIVSLALFGFWFGSLATVVVSTPETRFAILLVVVGIIGLLTAVPADLKGDRPTVTTVTTVIGGVASVLIALALFGAGKEALSYPAPAGQLKSASECTKS